MTDARQEDQDRIVGQPIKANHTGPCAVNSPTCRDLIQPGDDIQCVDGNWVHEGCVEAMEAQLAETDQANLSDDEVWVCPGCEKPIQPDEDARTHGLEVVHAEGNCADALDEKIAAANVGKLKVRTTFGGEKWVGKALFDDRTQEQIDAGKLADDTLDPRGYVVTCESCHMQWWGTPDNLPIRQPDKHFDHCTAETAEGRAI